jgi:hypothetical protein
VRRTACDVRWISKGCREPVLRAGRIKDQSPAPKKLSTRKNLNAGVDFGPE